jgi:AraC-like DNA-binding protein
MCLEDDLLCRIHRLLQETEPHYLKLDQLAAHLHISARTLKRRLQAQGTHYQRILDQIRMQRARQLLLQSSLSVDAIASALGYSDASNFSRAFRRCEGVTPACYRRDHNNKEH